MISMIYKKANKNTRAIRHRRVRAKITGTKERPRLSVYRSNKFIYASLVDDENNQTLLAISSFKSPKIKSADQFPKITNAYEVGKKLAKTAIEKKIKKIVFDRGGYQYAGRVEALARGARDGGLEF